MNLLLGPWFYRGPVWGGGDGGGGGGGSSSDDEDSGGTTYYNTYDSNGNLTYSGTSKEDAEVQAAIDSATKGAQDYVDWYESGGNDDVFYDSRGVAHSSLASADRADAQYRAEEAEAARKAAEEAAAIYSAQQAVYSESWSNPNNYEVVVNEQGEVDLAYRGDLPRPDNGNYTVPRAADVALAGADKNQTGYGLQITDDRLQLVDPKYGFVSNDADELQTRVTETDRQVAAYNNPNNWRVDVTNSGELEARYVGGTMPAENAFVAGAATAPSLQAVDAASDAAGLSRDERVDLDFSTGVAKVPDSYGNLHDTVEQASTADVKIGSLLDPRNYEIGITGDGYEYPNYTGPYEISDAESAAYFSDAVLNRMPMIDDIVNTKIEDAGDLGLPLEYGGLEDVLGPGNDDFGRGIAAGVVGTVGSILAAPTIWDRDAARRNTERFAERLADLSVELEDARRAFRDAGGYEALDMAVSGVPGEALTLDQQQLYSRVKMAENLLVAYTERHAEEQRALNVPVDEGYWYQLGKGVQDSAKDIIAGAEDVDSWAFKSGAALGSGLSFVAAAVPATILGGPAAGTALVAGMGAAANATGVYDEAYAGLIKQGKSPEEAQRIALGTVQFATATGVLEAASIGRALGMLPPQVSGAFREVVTDIIAEGGQEGLNQFLNNLTQKGVWDAEREVFKDVGEAVLLGAIAGGGISAGVNIPSAVIRSAAVDAGIDETTADMLATTEGRIASNMLTREDVAALADQFGGIAPIADKVAELSNGSLTTEQARTSLNGVAAPRTAWESAVVEDYLADGALSVEKARALEDQYGVSPKQIDDYFQLVSSEGSVYNSEAASPFREEIVSLREERDAALDDVAAANTDVARLERELTEARDDATVSDQEIARIGGELAQARALVDTLQTSLDQSQQALSEKVAAFDAQTVELGRAQTELSRLQTENEALLGDLDTAQNDLQSEQTRAQDLQSQLQTEQGRVGALEGDLSAANQRVSGLENDIAAKNAELAEIQGSLDSVTAELEEARTNIARSDETLFERQERISALEQSQADLEADLANAQRELESVQGTLAEVTTARDELQGQYDAAQGTIGQLEADLSAANENVSQLDTLVADLTAERDNFQADLALLESVSQQKDAELTARLADIDAANVRIAQLEGTEADLFSQLSDANQRYISLEAELAAAGGQNADLQAQLDSTLSEVQALDAQIADTQDQLAAARQELSTVEGTLSTRTAELDALQTEYDNFRTQSEAEIADLQSQSDQLEQSLSDSNRRIIDLESQLEAAGGQNAELQAELNAAIQEGQAIQQELLSVQEQLDTRTTEFETLTQQYDQLLESYGTSQQELGATQERLDISEADLAALRDEYSTYQTETEAEIAALQEQASEYERRVAEYEQGIAERDTQIADLETQLTDVTSQLTSEQAVTADQAAQITQLNEQIATLTSERDALQSEYDAYRQQQESAYSEITNQLDQRTQELADVTAQYNTIQEQYAAQTEALTLTQQELEASQAEVARTAEERAALEAQMRRGSSIFGPVTGGAEEPPEGAAAPVSGGGAPAEERPTVTPTTPPTALPSLPTIPTVPQIPTTSGYPWEPGEDTTGAAEVPPPTTNVPGTTTQMPSFGTYERPTLQPVTMGTSAGPFQPFQLRMPAGSGIQTLQPRLGTQPQALTPQQAGFSAPAAGVPVTQSPQQYYNPQFNLTTTTPTGGYGMPQNWLLGAPPAIRDVTTQGIGQFLGRA